VSKHPFFKEWSQLDLNRFPYCLPEDKAVLDRLGNRGACAYRSWEEYIKSKRVADQSDKRLHLGILPEPFLGDPRKAKIVVLSLNPRLGPHNYFAQHKQPEMRAALEANLRLKYRGGDFMFLDPRFSWHAGFTYWNGKLSGLIAELGRRQDTTFHCARERFRRNFATLELVPYYSQSFGLSLRTFRKLHSVELAKSFVTDVLVARARQGKCLLIAMRKTAIWNLQPAPNVVVYGKEDWRSARLTPNSPGGARILEFLTADACLAIA
jgi:hypothetical protein